MTAVKAVLTKTEWGADDVMSAIKSLVGDKASRADGWDLSKRIVEELQERQKADPTLVLTRYRVREAVLQALQRYTGSAIDQLQQVIRKEYEQMGVQLVSGPRSDTMLRGDESM